MKLFSEDTLAHYGIPGQKWGTRRWQYADGRFNEEGKIRYFGERKGRKTITNADKGVVDEYIIPYGVPLLAYAAFELGKNIIKKSRMITIDKLKFKNLSKLEHMSNNEKNKEIENKIKERKENEVYNEELGLYEKNENTDYKDDIEKVNPHYKTEGIFNDGPRMNCVYCSNTYVMRRAGLDATAKYNSRGVNYHSGENFSKELFGSKNIVDSFWNSAIPNRNTWTSKDMNNIKSIKAKNEGFKKFNELTNKLKPNQAITFSVFFYGFGGHALAAEKINGKLKIIDAQSNKVFDGIDEYKKKHPSFLIKQGEIIDYSNIKPEDINKNMVKNMMY